MNAKRLNYNINIDEINAGSSDPADISNGGTSWKERQVGYAFRLGYNYDNRYMAEVSGRYDGHYYLLLASVLVSFLPSHWDGTYEKNPS